MEDANAAEWDLHRRGQPARLQDDADGWRTVARPDKGKGKVTQQPTIPRTTPSKSQNKPRIAQSHHGKTTHDRSGKWQDASGQVAQTKRLDAEPPKPVDADEGNEAQGDWRELKPAKLFVRVSTELAFADDGESLQRLAREHFCYVASDQRATTSSDSQTFGIWGVAADAENTRLAITKWIEEMNGPQRSARAGKFAKLSSMTPALRQREENRWKRMVQKERYRQHPPVNMAFGAIGTFHWPMKDYAPKEILGPNYEALDPIRMSCSCYVVWQKNAFQIMGKSMEKVKAALLLLKRTIFQIAAKQLPTTRMYLIDSRDGLRFARVCLEEYEHVTRQLSGPASTAIKQHLAVRGESGQTGRHRSTYNERDIHSALLQTLSKLPYYRGSIKLRLHYGRFLATQFMLPENGTYNLEDYESMIKESQFYGTITDELGDREMEQEALSTLRDATDLLIPLDPVANTLSDVQPTYTVVFEFADNHSDVRLTSSWMLAQDGRFCDRISTKWSRVDRESSTATSLLQICLTDLSTSFGWAFNVDANQPMMDESRIEPALLNFAHSLRDDAAAMQRQATDRPFLRFNAHMPRTALRSIEQHVTYTYGMSDIDYKVELTRFQKIMYPERETGSLIPPQASQGEVFEPRWGVSVHGAGWDAMFAENERLAVGEKVSWEADSERWFPKSWQDDVEETDKSRYFSDLMARLRKIDQVLRSGANVEDLLRGMSIT